MLCQLKTCLLFVTAFVFFGVTVESSCPWPTVAHGIAQMIGSPRPQTVNGIWATWSSLGACSASCGGGVQSSSRKCNNPPPANGGAQCTGNSTRQDKCSTNGCPVNGNLTDWSNWGSCSATCGGGLQSSSRTCNNPTPAYGGVNCTGNYTRQRECNTQSCPVDGGWSAWKDAGKCDCTRTFKPFTRTCTDPSPANNGSECVGRSLLKRYCVCNGLTTERRRRDVSQSSVEDGEVIKFACHTDYILEGESKATCENGKWSSIPTCKLYRPWIVTVGVAAPLFVIIIALIILVACMIVKKQKKELRHHNRAHGIQTLITTDTTDSRQDFDNSYLTWNRYSRFISNMVRAARAKQPGERRNRDMNLPPTRAVTNPVVFVTQGVVDYESPKEFTRNGRCLSAYDCGW